MFSFESCLSIWLADEDDEDTCSSPPFLIRTPNEIWRVSLDGLARLGVPETWLKIQV